MRRSAIREDQHVALARLPLELCTADEVGRVLAEELLLLPGRPTVDLRVPVSPQNITAFASRATFVCGGLFGGRAMIHLYNSG